MSWLQSLPEDEWIRVVERIWDGFDKSDRVKVAVNATICFYFQNHILQQEGLSEFLKWNSETFKKELNYFVNDVLTKYDATYEKIYS